jgi:uncharacterized protein involved in outer membrane biogenesis
VALRSLVFEGTGARGRATANLKSGAPMTVMARLEIDELNLNHYLPQAAPEPTGGRAGPEPGAASEAPPPGWSEEPFPVDTLTRLRADIVVDVAQLFYRDIRIRDAQAKVVAGDGRVDVTFDRLALDEGTVRGEARFVTDASALAVDYSVAGDGVQARPLLTAFAGLDRLSGLAYFDAQGRAWGSNQREVVETLNGSGAVRFLDGAIEGLNLAAALRQVKTLGLEASAGEAQRTDFSELGGTFVITNGLLVNDDLTMLAPLLRVDGVGRVALPPRTLDYDITAKLVGSLEGQGGQRALAGLPIPIAVRGPWHALSYDIDWTGVLQEAVADPARIMDMPETMKQTAANLGIDIPIPELPGAGALPDIIKALPGLPGTGEAPAEAGGGSESVLGVLEGVLRAGPGDAEPPPAGVGGLPVPAPAPAPAPDYSAVGSAPTPAPAPLPAPAPAPTPSAAPAKEEPFDPLNVLKDLDLLRR